MNLNFDITDDMKKTDEKYNEVKTLYDKFYNENMLTDGTYEATLKDVCLAETATGKLQVQVKFKIINFVMDDPEKTEISPTVVARYSCVDTEYGVPAVNILNALNKEYCGGKVDTKEISDAKSYIKAIMDEADLNLVRNINVKVNRIVSGKTGKEMVFYNIGVKRA